MQKKAVSSTSEKLIEVLFQTEMAQNLFKFMLEISVRLTKSMHTSFEETHPVCSIFKSMRLFHVETSVNLTIEENSAGIELIYIHVVSRVPRYKAAASELGASYRCSRPLAK